MWFVVVKKDGEVLRWKDKWGSIDPRDIARMVSGSYSSDQPNFDSREEAEKYLNDIVEIMVTANSMPDLIKMPKRYSGPKMLEIRRAFRELLEEEDQGWDW